MYKKGAKKVVANSQPPLPIPKDVKGHSKDDNLLAASNLKAALSQLESTTLLVPIPEKQSYFNPSLHESSCQFVSPVRSRSHLGGGDQDETWRIQSNHLLIGQSQNSVSSQYNIAHKTVAALEQIASKSQPEATSVVDIKGFVGLRYGSNNGFNVQDSGVSVIRRVAEPKARAPYLTTLFVGEGGCDIAMHRESNMNQVISIQPVCLDPDLPPLAAQHPTRIWNNYLHSRDEKLQPVVRMEYNQALEKATGTEHFVCRMSVALSPRDPLIRRHPLYLALPVGRSPEYIAAVDALGGARFFTSDPKQRMADAGNSATAKCVAAGTIEWLMDPVSAPLLEDLKDEDEAPVHSSLISTEYRSMSFDSDNVVALNGRTTPLIGNEPTPKDLINQELENLVLSLGPRELIISKKITKDETTGHHGCTFQFGFYDCIKTFEEPKIHVTPEAAEEAVYQRATEEHIRSFFHWYKSLAKDGPVSRNWPRPIQICEEQDSAPTCISPCVAPRRTCTEKEMPLTGILAAHQAHENVKTLNWQQRLSQLCKVCQLPPPQYSEVMYRSPDTGTQYLSIVGIRPATFENVDAYPTVWDAREAVARHAYGYFGQPRTILQSSSELHPEQQNIKKCKRVHAVAN